MIKEDNVKGMRLLLALLICVFFVHGIFALNVTISAKPSFNIGENVSFNYTFSSDTAIQNGQYIIGVSCPSAPIPLLQALRFNLQANHPLTKSYVYMSSLSDSINPQTCTATIDVTNPINYSQSAQLVLNTNPSFNFNVETCKDSNCSNPANVFITGNKIYLNYYSNLSNISVLSHLTLPDGRMQNLNLPVVITAGQTGTYSLNVTASKLGYKTLSQIVQFGVIEKEPHIGYTSLAVEKKQAQNATNSSTGEWVLIIIGGVIVLAFVLLFISIKIINKKNH